MKDSKMSTLPISRVGAVLFSGTSVGLVVQWDLPAAGVYAVQIQDPNGTWANVLTYQAGGPQSFSAVVASANVRLVVQ